MVIVRNGHRTKKTQVILPPKGGNWPFLINWSHHKIFVWERNGNYQDCFFPNPVFGHFLGGTDVLGKNVRDILHPKAADQMLTSISEVLDHGQTPIVHLSILGPSSPIYSIVRLFPCSQRVMGFVHDIPLHVKPTASTNDPPKDQTTLEEVGVDTVLISPREREVLSLISKRRTNTEMAQVLTISERTVRFHLENLFRKFRVSSRVELIGLLSLALNNWECS